MPHGAVRRDPIASRASLKHCETDDEERLVRYAKCVKVLREEATAYRRWLQQGLEKVLMLKISATVVSYSFIRNKCSSGANDVRLATGMHWASLHGR